MHYESGAAVDHLSYDHKPPHVANETLFALLFRFFADHKLSNPLIDENYFNVLIEVRTICKQRVAT